MKITISEIKNILNEINGRLDIAEEFSEFEDLAIEKCLNKTKTILKMNRDWESVGQFQAI